VLVDPDVLRALATQTVDAADSIDGADLPGVAARAADGLDRSTSQWAARLVATHLDQQCQRMQDGLTTMGQAVRGAGENYRVTDEDLAADLTRLWR
jgi:uncharacterized protein YukE